MEIENFDKKSEKHEPKLKSLTIREKFDLINLVDQGKSIKEISKELGISKNTLHYIYKNKEKICQEVMASPGTTNKKRIKQIKCPELEEHVLNWMYKTRSQGEKITGSLIKSFALEIANKIGIADFQGSNGWLCSFFKRNEIVLSEFNGDNDTSVQLIKVKQPKRSFELINISQNFENIEFDPIQESPEKNKTETKEDEYLEEETLTYTADWRNWCRLCGSVSQTSEYCPNLNEILQRLFNFNPEEYIKICDACQNSIQDINNFMEKGKLADNMFSEFEELESQNNINDEMVLKIRAEYGFESNEEEVIYEDVEMEEILENENLTDNDSVQIEEYIYEDLQEDINDAEFIEDQDIHETKEESLNRSAVLNTTKFDYSEYNYTCHVCNETFEKMYFLTNHTREQHSCLPQVACITCGKYLATWESILSHRRKHSTEAANYQCTQCNAKFVTQTGLSIHTRVKHDKTVEARTEAYNCEVCAKEFKDAQTLKNHSRVHLPDDEKFPYKCETCGKRLANRHSLKNHILTVHLQSKMIACHLCTKTFSSRSNLRSHLISHTTENVKCPECNLVFKNRISLQSHKKLHKENAKHFKCPDCDKVFFNRNHLNRHQTAHSDLRNYKCDVCGMAYKWEKDLKNHMLVHENNFDEIFECGKCEKKFSNTKNLQKHAINCHENPTSEILIVEEIVES